MDTFRSDLDITVGNITLSSPQPLLPVVMLDELGDKSKDQVVTGRTEVIDSVLDDAKHPSFSLNMALPVVNILVNYAELTRRVQPTVALNSNSTLCRCKNCVLRAL